MSFIMGFIGAVLLVTAATMAQGVEVNVRLVGNKFFEGGLVEIWKDGAWGLLCDGNRRGWNLEAGHLVCQNLGFAKARRVDHGSTGYAQVQDSKRGQRDDKMTFRCHLRLVGLHLA